MPTSKDNWDTSPEAREKTVMMLLKHGAEPLAQDAFGTSALQHAIQHGLSKLTTMLQAAEYGSFVIERSPQCHPWRQHEQRNPGLVVLSTPWLRFWQDPHVVRCTAITLVAMFAEYFLTPGRQYANKFQFEIKYAHLDIDSATFIFRHPQNSFFSNCPTD